VRLWRRAVPVALVSVVLFPALAQQPAAGPSSTPPQNSGDKKTIKSKVREVLLDVVVTDGKGTPVPGLRQQDFSVFEDGKPQPIDSFEVHHAASELPKLNLKPLQIPILSTNTFLNVPTPHDNLPLTVLLYDLLNTPIDDAPFAHKEVVKFLTNKPAGRFAIFVLTDKLHLLQGFTDDEQALVRAMNDKKTGPYKSPVYQSQGEEHLGSSVLASDPHAQELAGLMGRLEDNARNFLLTRRVERTMEALADIARFVNGLPGRKNLIWLSGAFPATILPGSDPASSFGGSASSGSDPFGTSVSYSTELRQAADLLTVGQIAVYPVDIRGLMTNPVFAASENDPTAGTSMAQRLREFQERLGDEHDTMDKIAEDSGGHAFYNTNGLEKAIATGMDDGTNYYTLSYSPTNTKFNGGLRRIRVALNQKGRHLSYRRSYLADDDSVFAERKANAPAGHLEAALRRGAPAIHELAFGVHAAPQGWPVAVSQEQIAQLVQFPAFASQKKWDTVQIQRYSVDFAVLGRQIDFAPAGDGARHAMLEFLFAAYDAEGNSMVGQRSLDEETLSSRDFAQIHKGTYRVRQLFEIPSNAAWLRLVVHDARTDRIGAMEIALPLAAEGNRVTNAAPR